MCSDHGNPFSVPGSQLFCRFSGRAKAFQRIRLLMNHITVAVSLFLQMPGQHPEQAGLSFEFMQWIVARAVSLPET